MPKRAAAAWCSSHWDSLRHRLPLPPTFADAKMIRVDVYRVIIAGGKGGQARQQFVKGLAGGLGASPCSLLLSNAVCLRAHRPRVPRPPRPLVSLPPTQPLVCLPNGCKQVFGCVRMDDFLAGLAKRVKRNSTSLDIFRSVFAHRSLAGIGF